MSVAAKPRPRAGQLVVKELPPPAWDGELSNSARSQFLNCRQKFAYQYLHRLSPRAPEVPFLVGGLVHNGLERMYKEKGFDEDAERAIAEEACEKACMETSLTTEQSDKVWEQQAQVMGILRGYNKLYLKKDLKEWEIVQVERSFCYPLPVKSVVPAIDLHGRPLPPRVVQWKAVGKRDMVVRRKKDGKVVLVEHKTASRVDASYVSKLPLDNQIIGYSLSIKKETGKLPAFVTYNVMKKTALRKGKKETFEQFTKRIEDDYTWNPVNYFYRTTIPFSERDVVRFEQELVMMSKEMGRAITEKYFYKNTGQCTIWGKPCHFMPLCIEGPNRVNLMRFRERAATHEELVEEPQDR